jgi:hypothetical protein
MSLPAIIFGVVLSSAYGTAFHFWKGGSLAKLILYVILAWLGFWLGNYVGTLLKWTIAPFGQLNIGMATLGSAVFLFVGEWLGRVEITRK